MKRVEIIADGAISFRGDDDQEKREVGIAPPIIRKIHEQMAYLCKDWDGGYCLEWKLLKGSLFGQEISDINGMDKADIYEHVNYGELVSKLNKKIDKLKKILDEITCVNKEIIGL